MTTLKNDMKRHILTAAVAMALCACGSKTEQPAGNQAETGAVLPQVETDVVHQREVDLSEVYTANIEADNLNNIAPAMSGRIRTITVDVGDPVTRGQVVATLDASTLDRLKVQLDQAERDYNRAAELLQIGSGTRMAVEQAKAQLDALRTQYDNTRENTVLTSPITGVVTARNYDPGDMSGQLPIISVGQLRPNVKAMINVTESDLSRVRRGMQASVRFDAWPDEAFAGTVTRIAPTVDPGTRTFAVEVEIPNREGRLLPGQFAYVTLDMGSRSNVVVPDRAVIKQSGSGVRYVYVLRGDSVEFRRVELGRRLDNAYEVLEGIADGEQVVISGQSRLSDGARVAVQK